MNSIIVEDRAAANNISSRSWGGIEVIGRIFDFYIYLHNWTLS